MADKTVGEIPRATNITTTDVFVLEQAGQAKSLTGQTLINDLADALDGHGGIKNIELNNDYTITFILADDTTVTTASVRGAQGDKGAPGADGRAVTSIKKTNTSGLVDTYTVSFSDDTTSTFDVTNGTNIQDIAKTGTNGLVDTYTVTLTDGTTTSFFVTNGNGIASVTLQSGTHAAGTSDVYKITFNNGEFYTFSVYNGMNGSGSVSTVNKVNPDDGGNVTITADDIPYVESTEENTIADGDYFPFYDVSAASNRKTLWSNIIAKIRTALFGAVDGVLKADGSGTVTAATVDSVPTADSTNLVTSGGVKSYVNSTAAALDESGKVKAEQTSAAVGYIGESMTLTPIYAGKFYRVGAASAVTITIGAESDGAWPADSEIELCQWGAGAVTIAGASGVVVESMDGARTIAGQFGCVCLKRITDNYWLLSGALT